MKKTSPFYVDNSSFVQELRKSNHLGRLTNEAGSMIMRIADGLQSKYTYKSEELKQDVRHTALAIACEVWKSFRTEDVLIRQPLLTISSEEMNAKIKELEETLEMAIYQKTALEDVFKTKVSNANIQAYSYADVLQLQSFIPEDRFFARFDFYVDADAGLVYFEESKWGLPNAFSWFTSTCHNGLFQGMNDFSKGSVADYSYSHLFEGQM